MLTGLTVVGQPAGAQQRMPAGQRVTATLNPRPTTNEQVTPILHAAGFGPFYPCLPDGYSFKVDAADFEQDIRYGVSTDDEWVVLVAKLRVVTAEEARHPEQLLQALQAVNPHHRSSKFQIDWEEHRETGVVRRVAWLSLWAGVENGRVTPDAVRGAVAGIFDTIRATEQLWRED